ncbi:HNH endonuclease [Patescibacteria group bacterium]|nr:HNH endonuclease [Patescibacteria group bacterium]
MKLSEAFNSRYKRLVERSEKWGKRPPNKDELWGKLETCFLDGFKCCYCGCKMLRHQTAPSFQAFSIDHYIPFAAGGDNTTGNIVFCCHSCNIVKGTMSGDTFKELLKYIPVELKNRIYLEIWKGRLAEKLDRIKVEG